MSTLLSNDDLNDFIKPSVACIKPVENFNQDENQNKSSIQIGDDDTPLEVFVDGTSKSLEPAQISLSDCLACSGCITSAEEVLVAQHSHQELLNALKNNTNNERKFVASISHQSRASLALAFNLPIEVLDLVLIDLFINKFGFHYIVGTELGRLISLKQSIDEIESYKNVRKNGNAKDTGPLMSSICPGWVLYVEKTHPEIIPNMSKIKSPQQITGCLLKNSSAQALNSPIEQIYHLSIMPCFDKKLEAARPETEDQDQSSQSNVKDVDCVITAKELIQLMNDENISFESYINEFVRNNQELITQKVNSDNIDEIYRKYAPEIFKFGAESWYSNLGSASGGYADNYLRFLQKYHEEKRTEIVTVRGRNEDIYEHRLIDIDATINDPENDIKILGSVAVINGFRNIQNLIRKVGELSGAKKTIRKKGILAARRRAKFASKSADNNATNDEASNDAVTAEDPIATIIKRAQREVADGLKCDYVEVMACPGGCINGGGQISAPDSTSNINATGSSAAAKIWQERAEEKYKSIKTIQDINNKGLFRSLDQYVKEFGLYFDVSSNRLTETFFKKVESTNIDDSAIALTSKW